MSIAQYVTKNSIIRHLMEFCSIFNVIKRTAFASFNIHKLYLDIWESICRYSKLGSKNACQSHFCIAPCRKSHFTVSQMSFHAHRFPSIWPLDCFNRSSLQYWCFTTYQSTLPTLLVCLFFKAKFTLVYLLSWELRRVSRKVKTKQHPIPICCYSNL